MLSLVLLWSYSRHSVGEGVGSGVGTGIEISPERRRWPKRMLMTIVVGFLILDLTISAI
jgi:hypothetical protein